MRTKDNLPAEICYVAECQFRDSRIPELRLVVLHRKTRTVRVMETIRAFRDEMTAEAQAVEINFMLGWNKVTMLDEINQLTHS